MIGIKDSYIFTYYVDDSSSEFYNTFITGAEDKFENVKNFVRHRLVNYLANEQFLVSHPNKKLRQTLLTQYKKYIQCTGYTKEQLIKLVNSFIEDYLCNESERDRILRVFLKDPDYEIDIDMIYEILKDDEIEIDDNYYFEDWLVEIAKRLKSTKYKGNYMEFINEQINKFNNNEYFYDLEVTVLNGADKDTELRYTLNHRYNIYCKATMLLIKKYKVNSDEEFVDAVIKLISELI